MVAANEHGEAVRLLGAKKVLRKRAHLLIPAGVGGAEERAVFCGALVRACHASEVLSAAHGLKVATYEQKLHLIEGDETCIITRAYKRLALMLRLFSASAMVA